MPAGPGAVAGRHGGVPGGAVPHALPSPIRGRRATSLRVTVARARPTVVGIPLGDPAGVGPDLIVRALAADGGDGVIVFGDGEVLAEAARRAGVEPPEASGARIESIGHAGPVEPGRPTPESARAQWV